MTSTLTTKTSGRRLTVRQAAVLDFIGASIARRGYPPSYREIGAAVGLSSTSSVRHVVVTLEERGLLSRHPDRPRSYTLTEPALPATAPSDVVTVPVLGSGSSRTMPIAASLLDGDGEFAALRMPDDSMAPASIRAGDVLVVRLDDDALPDGLVAVELASGPTVQAATPGDARVIGRVVAMIRGL